MTSHVYVLGHPVGHSKSPAMHNAAYGALGLDWDYGFADCAAEDEALAFLQKGEWRACNVTMPYKPLALEAADAASAAAQIANGANVLVRDAAGLVHADNTDGAGCVSYLRQCGVRFEGARMSVCGTGPTAISIMHACICAQAGDVALISRDASRAEQELGRYTEALAAQEGGEAAADLHAHAYADASEVLSASDIIIDATSLGMVAGDPAPFGTDLLTAGQVVFDVVYGHGETALMRDARAAGCRAFSGEGMLVGQAVETLRDIAAIVPDFTIPSDVDLFSIMAAAAGFTL